MPSATDDRRGMLPLMLLLGMTTGLVDAVSVLALGDIFTANMTGNVAFLGFALGGDSRSALMPGVVALFCFLAGAILSGRLGRHYRERSVDAWLRAEAACEGLSLGAAAIVAFVAPDVAQRPPLVLAMVALMAAAMGLRNGTVRQLGVPDFPTTNVLTSTLTALAVDCRLAGGNEEHRPRRLAGVASIFAGAVVGGWLVLHAPLATPLLCAAVMVPLATAMFTRKPRTAPAND